MIGRILTATALVATLAACTSPQQQARQRQANAAEAFLDQIGIIGDPGRVAAADIAFARMARDEGQWTAFQAYAAPGAQLHGEGGLIEADPWLATQENPPVSVAWTPNTVWSSCDGTLAVSFGRFQEPDGQVGSYVTVWQWQDGGGYKYIYDLGGLDNPQPAARPDPDIPEDAIIVPGMTAINGMVADCPEENEAFGSVAPPVAADAHSSFKESDDGTLSFRSELGADGNRRAVVRWMRDGQAQVALDFTVPPSPGE